MNQKPERIVTFAIAAVVILTLGFFGSRLIANAAYANFTDDLEANQNQVMQDYAKNVAKEKDANKLAERALRLIKTNQDDLAIINLKRATEIDQNFRDAWVLLGLAEIQNDQPQEAITNLKNAENLDPTNPPTYQYLALAYKATGDEVSAQKADEKYQFLTKKQ